MPAIDDIRKLRKWLGGGLAVPGAADANGDIGQMLKYIIDNPFAYYVPRRISPWSRESIGDVIAANMASAAAAGAGGGLGSNIAWNTANRAIFIPFILLQGKTLNNIQTQNGSTLSGNVDVAVYDSSFNKLTSAVNAAQAGVSTRQDFNVADIDLDPGLYYMAFVADNTTATFGGTTASVSWLGASGVFQKASAYPLPAGPLTIDELTNGIVPTISVNFNT